MDSRKLLKDLELLTGVGQTAIVLWDQQQGVPVRGDYPLHYNTAHSIELNVTVEIPEWNGKKIRIMLEEDAIFTSPGNPLHRWPPEGIALD